MIGVVSDIGRMYKSMFVFPGREMNYRKINGDRQTKIDWLPPCYFYQREVAGVESAIYTTGPKLCR